MLLRVNQLNHVKTICKSYDPKRYRLDNYTKEYFKNHKECGSKDRKLIRDNLFTIFKWLPLIEHLSPSTEWDEKLKFYFNSFDPQKYRNELSLPPNIRVGFPEELFSLISKSYGEEKALEICEISNSKAPVTIRVNTDLIDRNTLLNRLERIFQHEIMNRAIQSSKLFDFQLWY